MLKPSILIQLLYSCVYSVLELSSRAGSSPLCHDPPIFIGVCACVYGTCDHRQLAVAQHLLAFHVLNLVMLFVAMVYYTTWHSINAYASRRLCRSPDISSSLATTTTIAGPHFIPLQQDRHLCFKLLGTAVIINVSDRDVGPDTISDAKN